MMKKTFTLVMLAFALNAGGQIPVNGLIGYWPFTGDAQDMSGNGHHGMVDGAMLTNDRFGIPGSAYHFNGNISRIILNDNLPFIDTAEFTISGWAIMDGPGGGWEQQNTLFEQRGNDASPEGARSAIVLMPEHQSGQALFIVRSSINVMAANSQVVYPSMGYGAWHHYVATLNAADTMKLYIDGAEVGSNTFTQTGDFITGIDFVDFGNHIHTGSYRGIFNGDIDEVRIYNRALNLTEITALFVASPLGVEAGGPGEAVAVYPNPATDHLHIDFGPGYSDRGSYTYRITNALGQTVCEGIAGHRHQLVELKGRAEKGIYLVAMSNKTGSYHRIEKVVVH